MVEIEEVHQIGWDRVVEGSVGEERNFEENAVINEKPVELSEDRCYMVTLLGFCDQSCCCILRSLELGQCDARAGGIPARRALLLLNFNVSLA